MPPDPSSLSLSLGWNLRLRLVVRRWSISRVWRASPTTSPPSSWSKTSRASWSSWWRSCSWSIHPRTEEREENEEKDSPEEEFEEVAHEAIVSSWKQRVKREAVTSEILVFSEEVESVIDWLTWGALIAASTLSVIERLQQGILQTTASFQDVGIWTVIPSFTSYFYSSHSNGVR